MVKWKSTSMWFAQSAICYWQSCLNFFIWKNFLVSVEKHSHATKKQDSSVFVCVCAWGVISWKMHSKPEVVCGCHGDCVGWTCCEHIEYAKTGPLRSLRGFKMAVKVRSDWAFILCDNSMSRLSTGGLYLLFIWILIHFTDSGKRWSPVVSSIKDQLMNQVLKKLSLILSCLLFHCLSAKNAAELLLNAAFSHTLITMVAVTTCQSKGSVWFQMLSFSKQVGNKKQIFSNMLIFRIIITTRCVYIQRKSLSITFSFATEWTTAHKWEKAIINNYIFLF